MKTIFRYYFFAVCFITIIFMFYMNYRQNFEHEVRNNVFNTSFKRLISNQTNDKVILLWTSFFSEKDYLKFPEEDWCVERRCLITSNRSYLSQSDAIIFHAQNLNNLPLYRTAKQYWIWFNLESPVHSPSVSHLNGLINWTATYRMDSDIWTPYGYFRRFKSNEIRPAPINYAVNKTKMAVWFVSNCHTSSKREDYVNALHEIIEVDVYGMCGDKKCLPKMSAYCYQQVFETYRFHLSFENSYCTDYVTEKFFHTLQYNIVPIVFGQVNYSALLPKSAYIDATDFKSPEELGLYLIDVSNNITKYNEYFDWKREYIFGGYHWSCELCRKLHSNIQHFSIYEHLDTWWGKGGNCMSWFNNTFQPLNEF